MSGRAIDDPAKLAKASSIMRGALSREERLRRATPEEFLEAILKSPPRLDDEQWSTVARLVAPVDAERQRRMAEEERLRRLQAEASPETRAHIKRIVDSAPPLTPEVKERLRSILGPTVQQLHEEDLARQAAQAKAEQDRRRASVRKSIARKSPAAIAAEAIADRLAAMRAGTAPTDPAVALAIDLMQKTGQSWGDAHANAETILEVRRLDAERRRTHANGHFWCVFPECPDAERDAESGHSTEPDPDTLPCGHSLDRVENDEVTSDEHDRLCGPVALPGHSTEDGAR